MAKATAILLRYYGQCKSWEAPAHGLGYGGVRRISPVAAHPASLPDHDVKGPESRMRPSFIPVRKDLGKTGGLQSLVCGGE